MMGEPDKIWLAIGVAAVVLPVIVYAEYLHSYVCRKMFGDEILDVIDEIAKESEKNDSAELHPKSPAR